MIYFLKKIKLLIVLAALPLLVMSNSFAMGLDSSDEAVAFAQFVQELIRTTQMPKKGSICILGKDEVSKIMIQNKDNDIVELDKQPELYSSCKAVYISRDKAKGVRIEIKKFHKEKIMTISTIEGFANFGGMVQVQIGRRSLELIVNPKEIKAAGIKLGAIYLSLIIN